MSTELFFQGFILLIHLGHISLLSHFVFCGCGFCSAGCSVVVLLACLLSVLWWMTLPKRCVQVSLWEGLEQVLTAKPDQVFSEKTFHESELESLGR